MSVTAADILNQDFPHYKLSAPWNDIIGKPQKDASILLFSGPGSGKSTVSLQMADEFTRHGKTAYIPAEEGVSSTLKDKLERLKLMNSGIFFNEADELDEVKEYVKRENVDILFIDSFTIFDKRLKNFEDFRKWCKKNDVLFVSIVQTTKEGNFYGNSDAAFNVDCLIKVVDGKPTTIETGKNRLGELYGHDVDLRAKPVTPVKPEERKNKVLVVDNEPARLNPADPEFFGIDIIDDPTQDVRENKGVSPDEIYQTITDMIIKTLEEDGELPFESRWRETSIGSGKAATNFVSKNRYRGINYWMLNFKQKDGKLVPRKLANPYFMTFNQVDEAGGKVKKGSTGEMVIYFTRLYRYEYLNADGEQEEYGTYSRDKFITWIKNNQDKLTEIDRQATPNQIANRSIIPILKYYRVFNAKDIEGVDWGEIPTNDALALPEDQRMALAQALYDNYPGRPEVVNDDPNGAFYSITKDIINMPPFSAFKEEQYYYSTLYHEAVHSTGAQKRLDRPFGRKRSDPKYWFEELVAELGAAYLCGESGILFRTIKDNAAYLKGYRDALIREMSDDNKFFFRAASRAQEAADYILDRNDKGVPKYRQELDQLIKEANKPKKKKKANNKEQQYELFRANGLQDTLIHLGFVEQLEWESDYDIPMGIKGNYFMFSSSNGKRLYIIPPYLVDRAEGKIDDKNAEKLYEKWNHFKADHKDLEIEFPDGKPQQFATAKKILYASDKIMQTGDKKGKINFYKHDFDDGKRPVSKVGDVIMIDKIKWDERGILN